MNRRIEKIAEMVNKGMVIADIGTDHAFLPILLIKNHISEKVYACDVNEMPLKSAEKNIEREGMQEKIIPVLSDGLKNVPADAEGIVIAGMGYYTAEMILENAIERLPLLKQIIVEVNSHVELLRRWISDHHYSIRQEICIHDRGHDYIAVSFDTDFHETYSEQEILCGIAMMHQGSEEYLNYCRKQIALLEKRKTYAKTPQETDALSESMEMWNQAVNTAM